MEKGESLRGICSDDGMPHRSTVQDWLSKDAEFAARYARACELRTEGYAEEIVDIADREDLDPNDKKVRIDARKWVAAKLMPAKYGERVHVQAAVTLEALVGASIPAAED